MHLRRHQADARVTDFKQQLNALRSGLGAVAMVYPQADTACRRELDGIAGIVDQHLAQTQRVAHQLVGHIIGNAAGEGQSLGTGFFRSHTDDVFQHLVQFKPHAFDTQLANFNF